MKFHVLATLRRDIKTFKEHFMANGYKFGKKLLPQPTFLYIIWKKYFEIWFRKFSELATLSKQIFLWLEVVNLSDNYFQKSHFTHLKNLVERSLRWAIHFDCLATLSKDIETWVNLFEFFMTWCCKLRWNWYQNQLLDFHRFKIFKGFPISHKMWWSGNTVIKNRNSSYN